jgi:hypothetical protein
MRNNVNNVILKYLKNEERSYLITLNNKFN